MKPAELDVAALVAEEARQLQRRRRGWWLWWAFVLVLVIYWGVLYFLGDAWWPTTLLLYGPRWPVVLPALLLLFYTRKAGRWVWLPIALSVLMVLFPILSFNIPVRKLLTSSNDDQAKLRVVTFNAFQGKIRLPAFEEYLLQVNPDVVLCQEWPTTTTRPEHWKLGWQVVERNNALVIATRHTVVKSASITSKELGVNGFLAAYELNTPLGAVSLVNVHLPTIRGQAGELEEVIHGNAGSIEQLKQVLERRQKASHIAREWIKAFPGPMILAGDFNMTCDGVLYREYWSDFQNAFSTAGWGLGYTKRTSWHGVRIDHVLHDQQWQCIRAEVGPDVGSDHLPVLAEFVLTGGR
jgi:vancomycin resistance protein VanJ